MLIAADVTATLDKIANYSFLGIHVVTLFVLYAVFYCLPKCLVQVVVLLSFRHNLCQKSSIQLLS